MTLPWGGDPPLIVDTQIDAQIYGQPSNGSSQSPDDSSVKVTYMVTGTSIYYSTILKLFIHDVKPIQDTPCTLV